MKLIKIVLCVLLLIAVAPLPYIYYTLLRVAMVAGCGALVYDSYKRGQHVLMFIYSILLILFQPFYKFVIHREEWIIIDVACGIFMGAMALREKLKNG